MIPSFKNSIKIGIAGLFDVKHYGSVFMNPFTDTTPFEVGFNLNTDIVNDQDYVHLAPTSVLPNGMPIGLPNPVVEIRPEHPISDKFDLYVYADVLKLTWIGVSATLHINTGDFATGLALNASFLPNDAGDPGIMASVFGPTTNADGTLAFAPIEEIIYANIHHLFRNVEISSINLFRINRNGDFTLEESTVSNQKAFFNLMLTGYSDEEIEKIKSLGHECDRQVSPYGMSHSFLTPDGGTFIL